MREAAELAAQALNADIIAHRHALLLLTASLLTAVMVLATRVSAWVHAGEPSTPAASTGKAPQ